MAIVTLGGRFLIPGVEWTNCSLTGGPAIGEKPRLSIELDDQIKVEEGDFLTVTEVRSR